MKNAIDSLRSVLVSLAVALLVLVTSQASALMDPVNYSLLSFGAGSDIGATTGDVLVVVAGDLDNDGDDDLISGDATGVIMAWRNDGTPFAGLWS